VAAVLGADAIGRKSSARLEGMSANL